MLALTQIPAINIVMVVIIVLYFVFGRKYQRYMKWEYDYKLFGWPVLLAVIGAAVPSVLTYGEDIGTDVLPVILKMLLFAVPGIAIATIVCFVKTRNLFLTAINIPITYAIVFVCGVAASAAIIAAVLLVFAWIFLPGFVQVAATGNGGGSGQYKATRKCSRCGMEITSERECGCR